MDWIKYKLDKPHGLVHIDIQVGRLIEIQPDSIEDTDVYCDQLHPFLDKLTEVSLKHNLLHDYTINLTGIDVYQLNPLTIVRMIWNIYNYTSEHFLFQSCSITGGGSIFNTVFKTVRNFLPDKLRQKITLIS